MANKDIPNGFAPHGVALRERKYVVGGAVYKGDPVKLDSSGRVVVAAANDALCGVAASTQATAGQTCNVWDHPDQLFIAQATTTGIDAQTNLGLNYNISASSSTLFKISRAEVDSATGATLATLPLKVLTLAEVAGEDGFGANAKVVCKINNHQLQGGTGTIGV
jgi:hypothetical protein